MSGDGTPNEMHSPFPLDDEDAINTAQAAYDKATAAMQKGIDFEAQRNGASLTGHQLRSGVNSAMVSHGALVRLLMRKGIFTQKEYVEELVAGMQQEVARYETKLGQMYGRPVSLQ